MTNEVQNNAVPLACLRDISADPFERSPCSLLFRFQSSDGPSVTLTLADIADALVLVEA